MFYNVEARYDQISLKLDIDQKTGVIKDALFTGEHCKKAFQDLLINRYFDEITLQEVEELTSNGLALRSIHSYLFERAIQNYLEEDFTLKAESDLLCLCYFVTKNSIKNKVIANSKYDFQDILKETKASSACGSCKSHLTKALEDIRAENGIVKGLDHSKNRFDEKGNWLKIKDLYPAELLLLLDKHKTIWLARENVVETYNFKWISIEGFHLEVELLDGRYEKKYNEKFPQILEAFSEYLRSELGILFFFHIK